VETEICRTCGAHWPTHSMYDLLAEPLQTETGYHKRDPLGWTAKLLFVVFNVFMAGWVIGAWRVGLHDLNFGATQHAKNLQGDALLAGPAQVLLPWLCGSVILGLLTYLTRGPRVFGHPPSPPWVYSTGVYFGMLVAVCMAIGVRVEDVLMTSPVRSAPYQVSQNGPLLHLKPPSVTGRRNAGEGSSWSPKSVPIAGQAVAHVEPATREPALRPMFQPEDEIVRCGSIIDPRRRAACLNGIGLGEAARAPTVARLVTPNMSGLPDLAKPVFLMRGGMACQTIEALMENSPLGCASADQDTIISVLVPHTVGQEYLREATMGYTRIAWKRSDGKVGVAYAMMSQLRN
jgi:hypothetical protein